MIDLTGKRGLVMGVANQRSIAASITTQLDALGAELALTYAPDPKRRFEGKIRDMAKTANIPHILPLDVLQDDQIDAVFKTLDESWGGLDFVVHSVAFADRADLDRPFSKTSREGWHMALDISAYSMVAVAGRAADLMRKRGGGSFVTMSFIGGMLAVPNYNVMGPAKAALESTVRYLARELGPEKIRCNAISAGAIRTLSSSGLKNFSEMLKVAGEHSAMERTVTQHEVAQTAAFLVSDASSGITGQAIYVDAGFNIMAN